MKKILFITSVIDSGGVAKSLVNTLSVIDYNRFDVHLLVLGDKFGVYSKYIPEEVNIITDINASCAFKGLIGVLDYIKRGRFSSAILLIMRLFVSLFSKSYSAWFLSRLFPKLNDYYDLIVDYNGQHQLYYMIDYLNGGKKVTFFHSDYNKWPYYKSVDKRYYPLADVIYTISSSCVDSLKENFPNVSDKVFLYENILSPSVINRMAQENIDKKGFHGKILLTLASVWYNKGIDLAIEASEILKESGVDFTWLFLGKIAETKWLRLVQEKKLQNNMLFIGVKGNPYPYVKLCDVFVHPSRFEGKSIALDEAKILCKPIVVTNFSTVNDQFENGVNATICDMDGSILASAIKDLLNNIDLRNKYVNSLKSNIIDNTDEINKLQDLI